MHFEGMGARFVIVLLVLAFFSVHASGDPKYISLRSDGDCEAVLPTRHLLQTQTECPVSFQTQDYSIITSVCKGPDYPVNACCSALVKFACPFADEINDNTTNCADTMFNYISIYGHYPAGLFANECHGDAQGLPCPAVNSTSSHPELHVKQHGLLRWLVVIVSTFALLFLHGGGCSF